jgi:hypothetical protein
MGHCRACRTAPQPSQGWCPWMEQRFSADAFRRPGAVGMVGVFNRRFDCLPALRRCPGMAPLDIRLAPVTLQVRCEATTSNPSCASPVRQPIEFAIPSWPAAMGCRRAGRLAYSLGDATAPAHTRTEYRLMDVTGVSKRTTSLIRAVPVLGPFHPVTRGTIPAVATPAGACRARSGMLAAGACLSNLQP